MIGLLACGSFLVFSVASMQEDVTVGAERRGSGTGGYELFGESTLPLPVSGADGFAGLEMDVLSVKVRDGDDASCFNLNRAQAPRLLGVDAASLERRGSFLSEDGDHELWRRLQMDLPDGMVPALAGDSDTAAWGLKMKADPVTGDTLAYRDEAGNMFRVKLVGKLPMRLSVFQGTLLVSDRAFTERFPAESGYRMFLFDVEEGAAQGAATELRDRFGRAGLDIMPAVDRLSAFYAVERTYLGMFLVLGGLGLLLGTAGLGIVVLRNVMERRGELAMLRAVGFSKQRVVMLVVKEHWMLLVLGLAYGAIAAAVAMWPSVRAHGVQVPWRVMLGLLVGTLGFGAGCVWLAARSALSGEMVLALRGE